MCTVPPPGRRRVSACTTPAVRRATRSRTRAEAPPCPPSTAMKALVIASAIFSALKGTMAPLRRITSKARAACANSESGGALRGTEDSVSVWLATACMLALP